jgi:hypothetical protein
MPCLYINTFKPLAYSRVGIAASDALGIPPFVDGSIRREPDLEHVMPAITCLCRSDKFAPRLEVDDVVVYMTCKKRYRSDKQHRRVVAILKVARLFDTHEDAAGWYRRNDLPVSHNCMVDDNPPKPIAQTHGVNKLKETDEARWQRRWDASYKLRAKIHGRVVVCQRLWADLSWNAPAAHDEDFLSVFGKVPSTRNPGKLSILKLDPFTQRLGIELMNPPQLSSPSSP